MTISDFGIEFIAGFEGLRTESYKCSAGRWTIGYGSTYYEDGLPVREHEVISKERALQLFKNLLPVYEHIVDKNVKRELTQMQYDMLVSHTYNTGGSKTLFKMINDNQKRSNIYAWWTEKYITAGGKKIDGLVRRRKEEADNYFKV